MRTFLVRAGTSRIIVVNRHDAPSGIEDRELALRLFGKDSVADGIGGDHYQLNKLAIWDRAADGGFEFTFYNLAPGSRSISRGAECGHAAVAVALVAGPDRPDAGPDDPVRVRNVDTGQVLEVVPRKDDDAPAGARLARILHEPAISMTPGTGLVASPASRDALRWEVVPAGNIFALIPGRRTCDDPVVRDEIQATTLQWARTRELPNAGAEFIRAISYDAKWETADRCRVEAVCHNGVEQHNSLPVSGSSALCNHLAVERLAGGDFDPSPNEEDLELEFDLISVSGVEIVTVQATRRSGEWQVVSTSCSTNARLLLEGTIFLSR